jgi:hypothetical protein
VPGEQPVNRCLVPGTGTVDQLKGRFRIRNLAGGAATIDRMRWSRAIVGHGWRVVPRYDDLMEAQAFADDGRCHHRIRAAGEPQLDSAITGRAKLCVNREA